MHGVPIGWLHYEKPVGVETHRDHVKVVTALPNGDVPERPIGAGWKPDGRKPREFESPRLRQWRGAYGALTALEKHDGRATGCGGSSPSLSANYLTQQVALMQQVRTIDGIQYVLVHADGGACHGTPLEDYTCPKCGISPDMQSTEFRELRKAEPKAEPKQPA